MELKLPSSDNRLRSTIIILEMTGKKLMSISIF